MKQRDTAQRTLRLANLSAQICMVNAGSEDLSHYVESKLLSLLQDTCKFANMDSHTIGFPLSVPSNLDHDQSQQKGEDQDKSPKKPFESLPKGYLAVPIPDHTLHVKMYSQNSAGDIRRAIFDMQRAPPPPPPSSVINTSNHGMNPLQYVNQPRRRRSRALFAPEEDTDSMDLDTPPRKLSRQVTSSIMNDDDFDDMSSQSSPSNSQALLFANNNNDINYNHNLIYGNHSNNTDTSSSHTYLHQSDNIYPPPPASSRHTGQGMYDPTPFVSQPTLHERPHSMTFGAPIIRTSTQTNNVRPPSGYPVNFTQLQNMIEENDNKSRFYPMVPPPRQTQESFLNEQVFSSTSQFQPIFPTPTQQQFMTQDQLLQQQQQHKRKQHYYQQQLERQQLERQQQMERQQQQDQPLFRRASGS